MDKSKTIPDIRVVERARCLLCGTLGTFLYGKQRDRLFEAPGEWDVMHCASCELLWLRTVPVATDIAMLYPSCMTSARPTTGHGNERLKAVIRNSILYTVFGYQHLAVPPWARALGWLFSRLPKLQQKTAFHINFVRGRAGGKLLDVGCGTGGFIERMSRLGWAAHGVEPDINAAALAERLQGITVHRSVLEDARLPSNYFDAITLNHVIEHLDNPVRTLREVGRLLTPGGVAIITTPNINGLGHRKFRSNWYHLDVPRHLVMFSPRSLQAVALRAGLTVRDVFTIGRQVRQTYHASLLISKHGRLQGFFHEASGVPLLDRLAAACFSLRVMSANGSQRGEEIVVVLTK